ncbi:MAG: N-acetylmuramoyl-L-alanine amidase [Nitrospinae bacterium]|nr:N-acetylmuramoyl-L-alanine amidase [Nitrospinota bacterium]
MRVIVLDPGHGGPDEGTRGPSGLLEKDVTLQVAQQAARFIQERLGLHAVLTRSDDSGVPLEVRAARANQTGGDLFISIHVGGSYAPAPRGFQTLYLDDRRATFLQGRDAATPGAQPPRRGQPPPRTAPQPRAVRWENAQVDFLDTSQEFARLLQKNLRSQLDDEERGSQGLPLLVLRWIRMPAVLLDLGSLSNPTFEGQLRDETYIQRVALGIAQAVSDYQDIRQ